MIKRQQIVFYLLVCAVILAAIYPTPARTIFYIVASLSLLFIVIDFKVLVMNYKWLILSCISFGILLVIHTFYFNSHDFEKVPMRMYIGSGTRFLLIALILFYLGNYKVKLLNSIFVVPLILACSLIIYASLQVYLLNPQMTRITTDLPATSYAYISSSIWLVYSAVMFQLRMNKWFWLAYLLISAGMLLVIFATGTRLASLSVPILWFVILFSSSFKYKKKALVIGLFISILSLWFTAPMVIARYHETKEEVSALQQNDYDADGLNSSNSLRLQIYERAFHIGMQNPLLGKGWSFRTDSLIQSNASDFLMEINDNHMHNEMLEQWSLRGILGVSVLIFFMFSLFLYAWQQKNLPLFTLTISMLIWMQTDVILLAKNSVMLFGIYIIFCIVYGQCYCQDQLKKVNAAIGSNN